MSAIHSWGFTVDDIGLDGYSTEKHLNNILDFLDEYRIKATFFAVPEAEGKRLSKQSGYVAIIRDAIQRGHEVAQHGLGHDRFEIGIPPDMILMLPHEAPARKFLAENRAKIKAEHTVAKICRKLREGRKIIEDVIGRPVQGFRSPALQSCENMFIALAEEEYLYDSSAYFQPAGWDIINNREYIPQEINRERFAQLQKTGLCELPLTTDYTWYLNRGNFDKAFRLAVHDFVCCLESGVPFVSLCHVSPVQEGSDGNRGFELYRQLIEYSKAGFGNDKYPIKTTPLMAIAAQIAGGKKIENEAD